MSLSPTKVCSRCKKEKSLSEFYKNKTKSDGFNYHCKECFKRYSTGKAHKKYMKWWRKTKKGKDSNRNSLLKKEYGITLQEYVRLFELQNGVCKMCKNPEIKKCLAVDHNHKTGKVRGLLCQQCNCMIGFIENKNLFIKDIQKYLEK